MSGVDFDGKTVIALPSVTEWFEFCAKGPEEGFCVIAKCDYKG